MALPSITAVYRLAQPPKLRTLPLSLDRPNVPVLQLRCAASSSRYNRNTGRWEDTGRLFIDAELIDRNAAELYPYLSKGAAVVVAGELVTDEWRTDSGEPRSRVKIRARSVHLIAATAGENNAASATALDCPPDQFRSAQEV